MAESPTYEKPSPQPALTQATQLSPSQRTEASRETGAPMPREAKSDLLQWVRKMVPRAQRKNHAAVRRWVGILDLEPPLELEALELSIGEELEDQRQEAITSLRRCRDINGKTTDLEAILALLEKSTGFPAEPLRERSLDSAPEIARELQAALGRYDRFTERLGWLLSPTPADEIEQLDPWEHRNRIYHFISYEFRLEQKLFAVLFELAPMMVPYAAIVFASTGEFTYRAYKRINDTVMFFSNMLEWGLETKRGRDAVARVNQIHGRYSLPNELFRFILSGIMFLPEQFNERLGWRPFTETEKLGWFYSFAEMGRAMNIEGVSYDYDEMRGIWLDMIARAGESSDVGKNTFREIAVQVLATYPADLRKPALAAILCGMPDSYRDTLGIPPPPAHWVAEVRNTLRLVGQAMSTLPRVPWIRSLQLHPLYRRVNEIGVGARSRYMPLRVVPDTGEHDLAARLENNDGRTQSQKPIRHAGELPREALPEVSWEEITRHREASDGWIVVHGYVYDVTRFLQLHPGGAMPLQKRLGQDASAEFDRVGHSSGALIMMANYRIAVVEGSEPRDFVDPERPGGKIHTGRKEGAKREYGPDDFEQTLDSFVRWVHEYETAKLQQISGK